MTEIFSDRHGFRPKPNQAPDDHLPGWVRAECCNTLQEFFARPPEHFYGPIDVYRLLRPYIWKTLGTEPPQNPYQGPWSLYIPKTLRDCDWWMFFDIVEMLLEAAGTQWGSQHSDALARKLDTTFSVEGITWKVANRVVSRRLGDETNMAIHDAQQLLSEAKYEGPNAQFTKAIGFLSQRPEPDEENCVKDAVGTLEAVVNIATGTQGAQLNTLLAKEPLRSAIHPALREMLVKLYGYRGDADGVAHGQIVTNNVDIADAELVLSTVAAAIRYVVAKVDRPQP